MSMKAEFYPCRFPSFAIAACLLVAVAGDVQAQHDHSHDHAPIDEDTPLGTVDFRLACDEAARPVFDRALTMMHHMMYEQARDGFRKVIDKDPDCAMGHWGVVTTLFQPLWGTRPDGDVLKQGRAAVEKARQLGIDEEREGRLLEATAAFFDPADGAAYSERIGGWIKGMEAAFEAAPGDKDVAALYALSRLTIAQTADDPHSLHDEAERILRGIYQREPEHPGAIHYIIHSDDVDGRARNNLEIVETYGRIAPDVPHALHMPSHIYVRLGDWPKVIEWNRRSAAAALEQPVGDRVSMHYVHAQDYMVYGYLQKGDDDTARAIMRESFEQGQLQASAGSAFHAATMPARIAVEGRDWAAAAALQPREIKALPWDSPMGLWAESQTWMARGLGAVHTGDRDLAQRAVERIAKLRETALDQGEENFANRIRIEELILAGWVEKDKDPEKAVERVRQAAELEARIEKHPITPGALLPPNEALGDLFMALNRPQEAVAAYRASDDVWPRRYNTLLGTARAAMAAGDERAAQARYAELLDLAGDSERGSLQEARRLAAR
jgi:hypothetical protein